MKKTAILISMFFLFLGCTQSSNMFLGVGQALDSEPPKINITSPENGIYVNKSSITITGNCVDNVGVARIRATAGISETASVVTEEIKLPSVRESSWTVTFDENDLDRILNLWRSGLKVAFTFTCYDTAGNSVVEHLFLYVDVELPAVIINRPEVRFTEDEKVKYEKDVASFKADYDINKFEKVNCFVNKEFMIKGYVDDDYSVKSTYINIYNATKKKQVAVTPIIFKDGTYIAGNGNSVGVTGNSQSWEFTLDSTLFCPTEGWHVLEVVTEDEAGNEKRQFVTKDWIYINQAADIPKNNFTSFSPDFKLNAGNMIAGNGFDDDGMSEVWIKICPKGEEDSNVPYTDWEECNEADYIVKKCADFAVGGQLGNWSLNVPSKAGEYVIYAVPVDIYGTAPQTPYEGIYKSSFSVASEEDPVVGIDSQFRGSTIVEKTKITGYFYDNNKVKTIDVSLKFDAEDKEEKITLYDFSKPEDKNEIKVYKRDSTFQLVTGQTVVKNFFEWEFDTQRFKAFKVLQMTLSAKDDDGNYGEDAVMIYGDSERPVFVGEISPANNSDVSDTNVFEGTVSDNVE
ncbi:MAG: Ig-like domain-containing protein, partial [Spirochaetota bacterium]|nr:Ig-like domain-containing protein [Spirochaetota bacterium]